MKDISSAITKLLAYNELAFSTRGNFTLIHAWINDGCDLEKDILPAIDELMQRNKNITTVNYFAPAVFKRRDNRLLLEQAKNSLPTEPINDNYKRAQAIAYRGRKLKMFINSHDEDFLNNYEKANGVISL